MPQDSLLLRAARAAAYDSTLRVRPVDLAALFAAGFAAALALIALTDLTSWAIFGVR